MLHPLALLLALLVAGCAPSGPLQGAEPHVLLLGERHDAPEHQRLHHDTVRDLAQRGRLAALILEMAERGASTAGLSPDADATTVRQALRWDDRAWPWQAYAPAIMAAVRAGVPVLGANLSRQEMGAAMADPDLDRTLPDEALARQRQAIRSGHCNLLPESQIGPMTRIQIARDRSMARELAAAARGDATVVLLAGSGHVDEAVGVPRHLPAQLRVRPVVWPQAADGPGRDYCAELRQRLGAPGS